MISHIKSAHAEKEQIECDICGKMVVNIEQHKKRSHARPDDLKACAVCGKKMTILNLREHMRTVHTKNKSPCPTCKMVFSNKNSLKVHMDREHLGIRFKCLFCPYQSGSRGNVYSHHSDVHPEEYAEYKQKHRGQIIKVDRVKEGENIKG